MKKTRRNFDAGFKAKVALAALKEWETLQLQTLRFELHSNQISKWKEILIENFLGVFKNKQPKSQPAGAV